MSNQIPPQISFLLQMVDQGYERKAWHGPNLRGSIRGLDIHEASWRPANGRHNIWEIIIHAAYWKYIVGRRLLGGRKASFPLPGSNWFTRPTAMTVEAWRSDLALLDKMHRKLWFTIAGLTSRDLKKTPRGSKVSNAAIISGIAAHDVYHAGQIQLLKRLYRGQGREGQAIFWTRHQSSSYTRMGSPR